MTFYAVLYHDADEIGVAYSAADSNLLFLPYSGTVEDWQGLKLSLHDGGFADYQPNDLGCRLCSSRLRDIFDNVKGRKDYFQWLDVILQTAQEERVYYIMHFPDPPDVLDRKSTIFADNFVVKPVLKPDRLTGHEVFTYPMNEGLPLIISDKIKAVLERENITGIEYRPIPMVDS